jgi:hypothetical protein
MQKLETSCRYNVTSAERVIHDDRKEGARVSCNVNVNIRRQQTSALLELLLCQNPECDARKYSFEGYVLVRKQFCLVTGSRALTG